MTTPIFIRNNLRRIFLGALGLGLLAMSPLALAATPSLTLLSVTPSTTFNISAPSPISFAYHIDVNPTADVNGNLYIKGPMAGSPVEKSVATFSHFQNGDYHLTWDGKFNGDFATSGQYEWRMIGQEIEGSLLSTNQIGGTLTVIPALPPVISNLGVTIPTFSPNGDGNQDTTTVSFSTNAGSVVTISVQTPSGVEIKKLMNAISKPAGNITAIWDGKETGGSVVSDGNYKFVVSLMNAAGTDTKETSVTVDAVTAPVLTPSVSGLWVTPNPYNNDSGTVTLGYTLNNSSGSATTTAKITMCCTDPTFASWTFTNQASGPATVTWNGKDTFNNLVPASTEYIFAVTGQDGANVITKQSFKFSVTKNAPQSTNCAGFSDLPTSFADCDAVTYVKSIGAMTGYADGTFGPNNLLQRDQIAKIALETFKKYNSGTNYCNGINPFPDVLSSDWAYQYICRSKALGVVTGYLAGADAGFYRPYRSVTRAEFLAIILRNVNDLMPNISSSSYFDVPTGQWFSGYAKYSFDNSLFTGSYLYPSEFTTRLEVAKVIYRLRALGKI